MNRANLINYIIKKQGYKSYLEIGLGTVKNFAFINCQNKVGVDPDEQSKAIHKKMNVAGDVFCMTSDKFFSFAKPGGDTGRTFDCVFLDGLHHADQVRKDIINAWECLTDGGVLILHDTNPHSEEITHVPRLTKEWTGDVYKAVNQVNNDKFTLKDDHGVTIIRKTGELIIDDSVIEWHDFNENRNKILNLKTWEECIKIIDSWT